MNAHIKRGASDPIKQDLKARIREAVKSGNAKAEARERSHLKVYKVVKSIRRLNAEERGQLNYIIDTFARRAS